MEGQINVGTPTGELVIDGQTMHCPAWCMANLLQLWLPNATRGDNVVIPHAAGTRAEPLRRTEANYSLPMVVTGVQAPNGTYYSDVFIGLETNLALMQAAVLDLPTGATRPATLTLPSGAVRTADIQVRRFIPGVNIRSQLRGTLEITVPAGQFA